MIITKTPFRISFVGGGTDLADFYTKTYGAVVSTAIDKYVYIALHKFFEDKILLKYSRTEEVASVDEIQHPLFRESFKLCDVNDPVEITSFADIPSKGSGLGSSSAFCVGLFKALRAHQERNCSAQEAAEGACQIEIERLKEPIGKQDQYASAYGGFNYIRFNQDGSVHVEPIIMSKERREELEDNLLMFHTGVSRAASSILCEQKNNIAIEDKFKSMCMMRDLADALRIELQKGNIRALGEMLHTNWILKKQLASGVSSPQIDEWYDTAIKAGAIGGKILGAGGGGFLLFYVEKDKQDAVRKALKELREVPFSFDSQGTRLIYVGD